MVLQDHEKQAIKAALRYANLRAMPMWLDPKMWPPEALYEWLREALLRIAASPRRNVAETKRERQAVREEIAPALVQGAAARYVFKAGRLELTHSYRSFREVCVFALALILDERRRLASRLHKCGWDGCDRFNLDVDPKGRPRRFCNPVHKARADAKTVAERVRKHRKEKEKAKRKEKKS